MIAEGCAKFHRAAHRNHRLEEAYPERGIAAKEHKERKAKKVGRVRPGEPSGYHDF